MADNAKKSSQQEGAVYEVRALTNRWLEPMKGDVISTHTSAVAAMDAFGHEAQASTDGTGRSSRGNYVAKAVVRVDARGTESVVLAPPVGTGSLAWPYEN